MPSTKTINVMIDARWIREGRRGIGVFTYSLLSSIVKIDYSRANITVAVPANMIDEFKSEFGNEFKILCLPSLPDPVLDFLYFPFFSFLHKIDVLHFTGNSGIRFIGSDCKTVLTVHDVSYLKKGELVPWSKKFRQIVGRIYRKFAVPLSVKFADRIVTVSKFAALDIQREFGMAFAPEFVYHGVRLDSDRVNIDHPPPDGVKNNYLVIGGSDPQKNIICVISAFSMMYMYDSENCPEVSIIGISLIDLNVKVNITPNIHFLGYQDHESVLAAIRVAKCTIIPSFYESFGLPLIESLFNFTPVICSDRGALKEIGGDVPIYFDPSSPESLINALYEFESGAGRSFLVKEWVSLNYNRFDWRECAVHYLRLYLELRDIN